MGHRNEPQRPIEGFEAKLLNLKKNSAIRRVLEYYATDIEYIVEDLDDNIETAEKNGDQYEADALSIVRNALNSVRIDLDLKAAEAKAQVAMFEKERDLAE
jgi:myosin heavy subunit